MSMFYLLIVLVLMLVAMYKLIDSESSLGERIFFFIVWLVCMALFFGVAQYYHPFFTDK